MFGFGKKHKTPDPSGQAPKHEPIPKPASHAELTARETTPADPSELSKKPWFGKLFKSAKSPLSEAEPGRVPPLEPAAPESPDKQIAPLPLQPPPRPVKAARDSAPAPGIAPEEEAESKRGVFSRLRERLSRTRSNLGDGLGTLFLGRKRIDDELMEELETLLITADVGVAATARIIADLTERVKRKTLADPPALLQALKRDLRELLQAADGPVRQPAPGKPQVILMVGVNGAGKTTTIGKLAKRLQAEGNSVMLAAGDTFRAAAVEQLETWGERNRIPVIAQQSGADSASVVFDALQAATARGADVLIADTAGRLHTKTNLMDELTKVARVLKKIDPEAPHEVMLVVDATTGQNALNQAEHFHRAVGLTGITLTKLDGTAKGGILFAIADRLKIPIRFIGVGESIDDLRPFDADEFLDALFG
ncbi:signal recognition particle-docking protein FtsY [Thiocystis minor]|uniref:signal recognition particle-docking protein FtsY n=1 Tax=Thiocystis minor TaxID=61597 RepID=UPI001911FE88|nr:signal recognition particle-docking protein FtsY [Thiocystis minor]